MLLDDNHNHHNNGNHRNDCDCSRDRRFVNRSKFSEMGRNQKFGGDMTSDWGGQGSGKIRSGGTCGDLGTDKCAEITGGGNFY